jgi:hypothetical protein
MKDDDDLDMIVINSHITGPNKSASMQKNAFAALAGKKFVFSTCSWLHLVRALIKFKVKKGFIY